MGKVQILGWLKDGDHINVYRKPTEFRMAKNGKAIFASDVAWLRRRKYVEESRPGNLTLTMAGLAIAEGGRL